MLNMVVQMYFRNGVSIIWANASIAASFAHLEQSKHLSIQSIHLGHTFEMSQEKVKTRSQMVIQLSHNNDLHLYPLYVHCFSII